MWRKLSLVDEVLLINASAQLKQPLLWKSNFDHKLASLVFVN